MEENVINSLCSFKFGKSCKIIFLGEDFTKKSYLIEKFKVFLNGNKNKINIKELDENDNKLEIKEYSEIHKISFNNLNLEICNCPDTNYCEMINSIKEKIDNNFENILINNEIINKEILILESEALNNIKDYLEDLNQDNFDIYIITFDYTKYLTFEEVLLYLKIVKNIGSIIIIGFNINQIDQSLKENFNTKFLQNEIKKIYNLNEDFYNETKFYQDLLDEINSINNSLVNIKNIENLYNLYIQNTSENNYKKIEEYKSKLNYYLEVNKEKLIKEFNQYEKLSFNIDCIPDESIIILQTLSLKGSKTTFEVNRFICHICKRKDNFCSKIILSNCLHCYCYDCMEIVCKKVTENTMRLSKFNSNKTNAKCGVKNCGKIILLEDAEKCGKMFGNI